MKEYKQTNPWFYATKSEHNYLTPEDITAAITAGGDKEEVWGAVLDAMSSGSVEDWTLCAFVSIRYLK